MVNENETLIDKIAKSGLLDVAREWVKSQRFVRIGDIQRSFSIGYETARCALDWLIGEGLVEEEPTYNRGYRVISGSLGIRIFLLDHNPEMVSAWQNRFRAHKEVVVVEGEFKHFLDTHNVETIVSPANSFGQMDGGYDLAIIDYFGDHLQKDVQRKIVKECYGEQPVGTSMIVNIPGTGKKLIHTPTMRLPSPIKDPMVVYQCMRVTLMAAIQEKVKSIVIPAFGACCGKLAPNTVAEMMARGYEQILGAHLES